MATLPPFLQRGSRFISSPASRVPLAHLSILCAARGLKQPTLLVPGRVFVMTRLNRRRGVIGGKTAARHNGHPWEPVQCQSKQTDAFSFYTRYYCIRYCNCLQRSCGIFVFIDCCSRMHLDRLSPAVTTLPSMHCLVVAASACTCFAHYKDELPPSSVSGTSVQYCTTLCTTVH